MAGTPFPAPEGPAGKGNEGDGCWRYCVKSAMRWRSNGPASGGARAGMPDGPEAMVAAIGALYERSVDRRAKRCVRRLKG